MRALALVLFLATWWSMANQGLAQGAAVREGGEVILRSLGKYLGKGSTRETVESLTEYGGEAAVRRVADRAMAEGGEQVLERVASVAAKHGPEALRAMDNVGNLGPVLRSLDDLPEESVDAALRRLAAGQPGRELAEVAEKYGAQAIKAELRLPGVGTTLAKSLGEEGISLSEKLTRNEAMTVAKHASDIAALPAAQRAGVLELLHRDARGMVAFMGRFMEKYPGRTLFAASATTIILAESIESWVATKSSSMRMVCHI